MQKNQVIHLCNTMRKIYGTATNTWQDDGDRFKALRPFYIAPYVFKTVVAFSDYRLHYRQNRK